MSALSFALVLIALLAFVAGQLVLKHAMERSNQTGFTSRRFLLPFLSCIFLMTISFFLILGLLQRYDLSYIFPFQGLSVIIISLAAVVVLRERLTLRMLLGALLISVGIVLVSLS